MKRLLLTFMMLLTLLMPLPFLPEAHAQEPTTEETVEGIVVSMNSSTENSANHYQTLSIFLISGSKKGTYISIDTSIAPLPNNRQYQVGDRLVILRSVRQDNSDIYMITDVVRRGALYMIFALFAVLAIVVGGKGGVSSLAGMAISFVIIFAFILPQILAGRSPVLIALIGCAGIVPVTFYLSHGFSIKTHIAIIGTLITLLFTGILSVITVNASKLTGFATEEAGFLQSQGMNIDMRSLLLAGIMIGVVGIMDDITISQTSIVEQIKHANSKLKRVALFSRAMVVGRDHIASLVNTLVLVYTGASLPLLLLFISNPRPFTEIINYEFIADEIIRTLVGSIGLIVAVPVTTFIAAFQFGKKGVPVKSDQKRDMDNHVHI